MFNSCFSWNQIFLDILFNYELYGQKQTLATVRVKANIGININIKFLFSFNVSNVINSLIYFKYQILLYLMIIYKVKIGDSTLIIVLLLL